MTIRGGVGWRLGGWGAFGGMGGGEGVMVELREMEQLYILFAVDLL